MISQSDAGHLIRRREPFKASNVYAESKNGLYVAYSYGEHFPLAVHSPDNGWLVNKDKYSASTGRQQSKTNVRSLPGATFLSTAEMVAKVDLGGPAYQQAQRLLRVTNRLKERLPA